MPAQAPTSGQAVAAKLGLLGQHIRQRRKALRVSAVAAAEAAGMSRVTLHRIERGEASVTMGAYLNAMSALGLELDVATSPPAQAATAKPASVQVEGSALPSTIALADYPQLQRLAWHVPGASELTPVEAFGLYERNWRHLDLRHMSDSEHALLDALVAVLGKGHLLV